MTHLDLLQRVDALTAENTRLTELVEGFRAEPAHIRALKSAERAAVLEETNTRHEAWRRKVESAAIVLLKEWADLTSQELYGEALRDLMLPADFDDWHEAHAGLRAAILDDESDKQALRQLHAAGSVRGNAVHACRAGERIALCGEENVSPTDEPWNAASAWACKRCVTALEKKP